MSVTMSERSVSELKPMMVDSEWVRFSDGRISNQRSPLVHTDATLHAAILVFGTKVVRTLLYGQAKISGKRCLQSAITITASQCRS